MVAVFRSTYVRIALRRAKLLRSFVAALALGTPIFACAAVPLIVDCNSTVRDFFAPLIQQDLIARKPFMVDQLSVNHFKPRFLKPLAAYGMPVTEILGFANDPLLFTNKNSTPGQEVYGVLVKEGIANVQAQLQSVGVTNARTFRVASLSTLILCKGISDENH
jgi:hypothetical protein